MLSFLSVSWPPRHTHARAKDVCSVPVVVRPALSVTPAEPHGRELATKLPDVGCSGGATSLPQEEGPGSASSADWDQSMIDILDRIQHDVTRRLRDAYLSASPTMVWALTAFLCFVEIFLRRPGTLLYAQPWAEDGGVFISQGLRYGFQSMLLPYAGYLHLIPRLVALFAIAVSQWSGSGIVLVPFLMNFTAIILAAMAVASIVTPSFDWLTPRKYRILLAIGILAAPYSPSIFGTITDIQWFLGVYQFFWAWKILATGRGPQSVWTLIAIGCAGLSGPFGGILALAFLGNWAYRFERSRRALHPRPPAQSKRQQPVPGSTGRSGLLLGQAFAICLGPVIESIIALPAHASQGPFLGGMSAWLALQAIVRSTLEGAFARAILPGFATAVNRLGFLPVLLIGCGVLAVIATIWIASRRSRELLIPFWFLLTYELLAQVGLNWSAQYLNVPYIDFGGRLDFIPYAVVLTTLVVGLVSLRHRLNSLAASDSIARPNRRPVTKLPSPPGAPRLHRMRLAVISSVTVLVMVALVDSTYFQLPVYGNFDWPQEVASYSPGGRLLCTAISLPGLPWETRFPCNITEISPIPLQINMPVGSQATLVGMSSQLAPLTDEFQTSYAVQGVGAEVNVLGTTRSGITTLILRRGLGVSGSVVAQKTFRVAGGEWLTMLLEKAAPVGQYTLEMTASHGVGWWEDLPGSAPGVRSLSGNARQRGIFIMEYLRVNGAYTVPRQIICPC